MEVGDHIGVWEVERRLGVGGFSLVFLCRHRDAPSIRAAIKLLEVPISQLEAAKKRFLREAEILYNLEHPNIVEVRNLKFEGNTPYLEMEYVEGEGVDRLLDRGALSADVAVELIQQLLGAVQYLHDNGIYHRDIKPENLIVDTSGQLKLVDFGLAVDTNATRLTHGGSRLGTIAYVPPEWVDPASLRPQAWDVYAIGTVFYELLTGKLAFESGAGSAVMQQMMIVMNQKQQVESLDPGEGYPKELRQVVRGMTHRDPTQRIASAREALGRLDGTSPIQTAPEVVPKVAVEEPEAEEQDGFRVALVLGTSATFVFVAGASAIALLSIAVLGLWLLSSRPPAVDGVAGRPTEQDTQLSPPSPQPTPAATPTPDEALSVEITRPKPASAPAPSPAGATEPALDPVAVVEPATDVVPDPAPPTPDPVPTEVPVSKAGPPVTKGAFDKWIRTHQDWQREAAMGAGRAQSSYLEGWSEGPDGSPMEAVVSVTPMAAQVYCASRGGIASIEAQKSWTASRFQARYEWRSQDSRVVRLSASGDVIRNVMSQDARKDTGFRCMR